MERKLAYVKTLFNQYEGRERSFCIEISFRMICMDFKRFDENDFWLTINLMPDLHFAAKCRREKFPAI